MIFAEFIPDATPLGMGNWLVDGAALAAMFLICLKIIDHFKNKPPMDQQLSAFSKEAYSTFAQKRELQAHRAEMERDFIDLKRLIEDKDEKAVEGRQEILEAIRDLDSKGEDRSIKLHDRCNALVDAVGILKGQVQSMPRTTTVVQS